MMGAGMGWVSKMSHGFLHLAFPPRCWVCGDLMEEIRPIDVCGLCVVAMRRVPVPRCDQCGEPFPDSASEGHRCMRCLKNPPHFDRVRSVFVYEEPVQSAILGFKFHGKSGMQNFFSEMLLTDREVLPTTRPVFDVIVPVPLHRFKLVERGYNQTALLAEGLSRRTGIPIDRFGLKKVRRTPPQSTLQREKREHSLRGAFRAKAGNFEDRRILMVDDVMTTGATLSECARVLKAAGAVRVEAVTVARAL